MSHIVYRRAKELLSRGLGWGDAKQRFVCLLVSGSYTPNERHEFSRQLIGVVARQDIDGRAVGAGANAAELMADSVVFTGLKESRSYRWVVLSKEGKTDRASGLIAAFDMHHVPLAGFDRHEIKWSGKPGRGTVATLGQPA